MFSATLMADRQALGEEVTEWLAAHPGLELADITVTQSSDHAFHCLTVCIFFRDRKRPRST